MELQVFAIYDTKAEAYLQPFCTHNKATAIRSFSDLANDPATQFHQHAGDYVLFQIASYDDQTAALKKLTANVNLGTALEFQQPTQVPALEAIQ